MTRHTVLSFLITSRNIGVRLEYVSYGVTLDFEITVIRCRLESFPVSTLQIIGITIKLHKFIILNFLQDMIILLFGFLRKLIILETISIHIYNLKLAPNESNLRETMLIKTVIKLGLRHMVKMHILYE